VRGLGNPAGAGVKSAVKSYVALMIVARAGALNARLVRTAVASRIDFT
jgi:hypothetical protein